MIKCLLVILFISTFTQPSISATNTNKEHKKFYLYGGFDLGYSTLSSDVQGENDSSSGLYYGARVIGDYVYNQFSLNVGFGFFNNKFESDFVNNRKVRLITKTMYLELNPQFRFDLNHSVGIIWQQVLGEKFLVAPSTTINSNDPDLTTATLLGLNYYYTFDINSFKARFGAGLLKPMSIGERSSMVALLSLQFGLPLFGGENSSAPSEVLVRKKPEPVQEEFYPIEARKEDVQEIIVEQNVSSEPVRKVRTEKAIVEIILEKKYINFLSGSDVLNQNSKDFIRKFSNFLVANPESWTQLSVEGHTDKVGKASYNKNLSLERAKSVVYALYNNGLRTNKITYDGHGEESLLDEKNTKSAHQKNRRVELHFLGKTDEARIQSFFKRYKKNIEKLNKD